MLTPPVTFDGRIHEPPNRLFGPFNGVDSDTDTDAEAGRVGSGVTSGRIVGSGRPFWTKVLMDYSIRRSPNFISNLRPIRCPFPPSRLSLSDTVANRPYGGHYH